MLGYLGRRKKTDDEKIKGGKSVRKNYEGMRDMNRVKRRDLSVDIVKALGIVCMVAGHCVWPFTHFIYLFHMAIFFIASGYCYKEANSTEFYGGGYTLC